MDKLTCKSCGCESVTPMEVVMEDEQEELALLGGEQESRFFTCHVCGDNWLSVKETNTEGSCRITFIHQMGMSPVLKRIAHMQTHVIVNDGTVDHWEYFMDDDPVREEAWREKLGSRRDVLRSVCMN